MDIIHTLLNKEKFDYYLVKCVFKLNFNDYEYCAYIKTKLSDNKTIISWQNFSVKVIDDFETREYNFNHKAKMKIITKADKVDMSFDFHIRHNMHAVEWKINALINKNKSLINKLKRKWRHPLILKIESYRFWLFNQILKINGKNL